MNYIANIRIPSERAHTLQTLKMCEALGHQRQKVRLVYPFRVHSKGTKIPKDPFQYYQVEKQFKLRQVFSFDLQLWLEPYVSAKIRQKLFVLQAITFAFSASLYCFFSREKICFTRDLHFAIVFSQLKRFCGKKLFFEEHVIPTKHQNLYLKMLKNLDGICTLTSVTKSEMQQKGIQAEKIHVAPDASSPFPDKVTLPKELMPFQEKIKVIYTGHLMRWKGVFTLAQAMKSLPPSYSCFFIGGLERDIQDLTEFLQQQKITNCHVLGHFPHYEIPNFLAFADLLILPNTAQESISKKYTSPLKLFEYMAAQKPIIASDLPSLREVLQHNRNAWLVAPDDPSALAQGIQHLQENKEIANRLALQAKQESFEYTWDKRAQKILEFIHVRS